MRLRSQNSYSSTGSTTVMGIIAGPPAGRWGHHATAAAGDFCPGCDRIARSSAGVGGCVMRAGKGKAFAMGAAVFVALALATTVEAADPSPPDANNHIDGLNADIRESFYTSATSLVAKLDLTQLGNSALMQTLHGMVASDKFALVLGQDPTFDSSIESIIAGPASVADALVAASVSQATVVDLSYMGDQVFMAVPLGFKADPATFALAKAPLEAAFAFGGVPVELTPRDDYALVHQPGAGLPPLSHSQGIEDTVLLGLNQANGNPALSFVSPVNDQVRALIASAGSDAKDIAGAISQADYFGGYLIGGPNPEIHLYFRYSSEATANQVKATYDNYWKQAIADADAEDQAEAAGNTILVFDSAITGGEFMRRLADGAAGTVFNTSFKLDLSTFNLREITGAFVDRFYAKPPEKDNTPPPSSAGAPGPGTSTTDSAPLPGPVAPASP
jgi:hypothetical protein